MNTDSGKSGYLKILIPVVLFIAIQLFPDIFVRLENSALDARYTMRSYFGKDPLISDKITLIAVDDYSHSVYGLDELPLEEYKLLFSEINNMAPKQLALDIFIKDKVGCESALRKAIIDESFLFVSPYAARMDIGSKFSSGLDRKYDSFIWDAMGLKRYPKVGDSNIPTIRDIVSYNDAIFYGFSNIISDADGKLRRLPLVANLNGRAVPHIVLQMIIEGTQYDVSRMSLIGQSLVLPDFFTEIDTTDLTIPLDNDGLLPVNFMGYDNYMSQAREIENLYISASDIIINKGRNTNLSDRFAILGNVSTSGQDIVDTPIEKVYTPIVYHMAANSVLSEDFVTHSTKVYDFIVLLVISVFLVSVAREMSVFRLAISGSVVILGYLLATYILFIYLSKIVAVVAVIFPSIVLFILLLGMQIYSSQVRMGVLEGSLNSYLSPNLMEKVKDDPDILKLGGSRKKISVLFSDIVGFTSFCDTVDSAEVQEVLEDYFSKMTDAIFNADGIVDKYLGDGILAFFENEKGSVSSPLNAMNAAIAMQEGARELDRLYQGMNRPPFEIRIGIATGYAKVGNIGPPQKVDYTVIGSVVNKAARLEGEAQPKGVAVDEDTYLFIKDEYSFTKLEDIELKGFSEKSNVYTIKI